MPPAREGTVAMTADEVKVRARELGFERCGIAAPAAFPELTFLSRWLDAGYAGEMRYLERTAARRADVRHVLPSVRSVIVLGTLYNVDRPYSTETADPLRASISRYAWGDDYHDVVGRRLDRLVEWMRGRAGPGFEAKPYVDTGPVQERVYAQHAGVGWIGKNTCVIDPGVGSWLFLSEILCNVPLAPDPPALDQCGSCTLCLEACPTGALVAPWTLDATRCISYLTIEVKGSIPGEMRAGIGSHVYGCDVCQDVCPWNGAPAQSPDEAWQPRNGLDQLRLVELWRLPDRALARLLKGSAMRRAGVRGLRRNLAVAIGNCGVGGAAAVFDEPRDPESAPTLQHPVVVEHVAWAKQQLNSARSGRPTERAGD